MHCKNFNAGSTPQGVILGEIALIQEIVGFFGDRFPFRGSLRRLLRSQKLFLVLQYWMIEWDKQKKNNGKKKESRLFDEEKENHRVDRNGEEKMLTEKVACADGECRQICCHSRKENSKEQSS